MSPPTKRLDVLLSGELVGELEQNQHGRLAFRYLPHWQTARSATPLSVSMPLSRREHPHATIDAFIRGLLPDNPAVLQRWGTRFGVSANNPFALLRHVGEDVAGAAQFLSEERLAAATAPGTVEFVDEN